MQNWNVNYRWLSSSAFIVVLFNLLSFVAGCRNSNESQNLNKSDNSINQITGSEDYPAYVKYRSFQNPDSTWGFTIFVNSRPFLNYKKIPVNSAVTGFESQKDADAVADLFTKMIRKGDLTPRLNNKALDTLGITIKNKKMQEQ